MATITIDARKFNELVTRLDQLTKDVATIKAKIFQKSPKYGSDEWWEKEHEEAFNEIKVGKVRELKSVNDLDKPLKELFP